MKKEEWRPTVISPDRYHVSSLGNIRSMFFRNGVAFFPRIKILTPLVVKDGYLAVSIRGKSTRIASLVAEAFIPNPDGKATINHKNGIKTDNRAVNLEWMTIIENRMHAFNLGLTPRSIQALGYDDVSEIRKLIACGIHEGVIAKKFDVCRQTIGNIRRGHTWSHFNST